jgi:hypothetical protein
MCDSVKDAPRTAIAVCGCGHDGRLGIGSGAPDTLHEITLLDDFLAERCATESVSSPSAPQQTSRQVSGRILQVACGAYHTLVLTTTGLYGWGLHEDGQLGLGRPFPTAPTASAGTRCCAGDVADCVTWTASPFYDAPTCITFFHHIANTKEVGPRYQATNDDDVGAARLAEGGSAEGPCGIISVHCGADHSIVHTHSGVYVTGRNDCGQLGLGHTEAVYTWTPLCGAATTTNAGAAAAGSPSFLSLPSVARADGSCTRVVQGQLTHISCGTHHTLLAWSNALVLHDMGRDANSTAPQTRLFLYPTLLLACGRGDFGELGYDGDVWAVLQTKAQRQERALLATAVKEQAQALEASSVTPYNFKWKAAGVAKPRRPPFNSPFLQPVEMQELSECAVELPATWALQVSTALSRDDGGGASARENGSSLSSSTCKGLQQLLTADSLDECWCASATASVGTAISPQETEGRKRWKVMSLQAMHHHSAATLCDSSSPDHPPLVLHWGCYYCSEVEDAAASIPRLLIGGKEEAAAAAVSAAKEGVRWGLHAGDEILLRYGTPSLVQVIGTGNLGRGGDDDEARTWADVPLSAVAAATGHPTGEATLPCVYSIHGRSHFLMTCSTQAAPPPVSASRLLTSMKEEDRSCCSCIAVAGFGDNLYGQLGAPAVSSSGAAGAAQTIDEDDEGDGAVVTPRLVLQVGDTLRSAAAVKTSLLDAAADHSHHRPSVRAAGAAASDVVPSSRWVVEAIRGVGAGARHSVFVVDVRRLP